MSYGAIITEHPIDGNSSREPTIVIQKRKTICTSFAEFLESRTMNLSILLLIFVEILTLMAIKLEKLEDDFIKISLNLIFVINIVFVIDVLLKLVVFGP